ncbi:MAG: ATP-binding cassette domain-containing protein [Methanolobus sp.]|uniref:ATP-binding cassette domain-containing protein n=1 Tax=Methanolobus sp. TaxID=1874737 RepID=UPI00273103FC|nr:ATP-binding cassette domain-containing protein [Methanolobus sp.]MDP2218182.1 ATP-binding cassette domain-containing protein [Methanolobus sp.]
MSDAAIHTERITKQYDNLTAVDNIDITVEKGELFGLLGPNGAGKSTLISMLSTMLRPTSGKATVWGYDISRNPTRVRQSIGVVFQETTLDQKLTGRENLDLHGRLYGLNKKQRSERMKEVLELVELSKWENEIVQKYSGGMMRRLEIARGLMHYPNLLFLDEPTIGLDPQTRNHIWEYIRELNRDKNITMVLTTHYMEEADKLCNRIAIIDHGRIITIGTPYELKSSLGGDIITLGLTSEYEARALAEQFSTRPGVNNISTSENLVRITAANGEREIPDILGTTAQLGLTIESVNLHKPTLDDVFLHYTGKDIRDDESTPGKPKGRMRRILRR